MEITILVKRKWQNLIHQECPNCGMKMDASQLYWVCPSYHENGMKCFVMAKDRVRQTIMDKRHPAYLLISEEEKKNLLNLLNALNLL